VIVGDVRAQAAELFAWCEALDEGVFPGFGRRSRMAARHLVELQDQLDAARSLIAAQDERIARLEALLARLSGGHAAAANEAAL